MARSLMSVNGVPYRKDSSGEWVIDQAARQENLERVAEASRRRNELIHAMQTRCCSEEELAEVLLFGTSLFVDLDADGVGYGDSRYVQEAFQNLLSNQVLIRQLLPVRPSGEKA